MNESVLDYDDERELRLLGGAPRRASKGRSALARPEPEAFTRDELHYDDLARR